MCSSDLIGERNQLVMRKMLLALAGIIMLLGLAACGKSGDSDSLKRPLSTSSSSSAASSTEEEEEYDENGDLIEKSSSSEKPNLDLRGLDGSYELVSGYTEGTLLKISYGGGALYGVDYLGNEYEVADVRINMDHTLMIGDDIKKFTFDGKLLTITETDNESDVMVFEKVSKKTKTSKSE